jgi:hypothetical protein
MRGCSFSSGFWLPVAPVLPFAVLVFLVCALEAFELLERVHDLRDIKEPVALETEIDEGGLHAGQDLGDPALVDIADDAAMAFTFDEDFCDEVVFEDGHHRLVAVGGDDHLLGHSRTPGDGQSAMGAGRSRKRSRLSPMAYCLWPK